jgi:hypothetical protein
LASSQVIVDDPSQAEREIRDDTDPENWRLGERRTIRISPAGAAS